MTKKGWKSKIKKATTELGTYKKAFEEVIEALAEILEQRDNAMEQFISTGGKPVISYTNKAGKSNPVKNPCLAVWNDLNSQAITYWKELGMTPAGLKRINQELMETKKQSSFAEIVKGAFADDQ